MTQLLSLTLSYRQYYFNIAKTYTQLLCVACWLLQKRDHKKKKKNYTIQLLVFCLQKGF